MPERPSVPSGLEYQPDFITEAEEQQLLGVVEAMELHTITCTVEPPGALCATSAWITGTSP
jgi:hypothetical protein